MPHNPLAWIDEELVALERQSLRRRLATHDGPQGPRLSIDGVEYLSFASNDYLGLAADPRLAAVASAAAEREGWGSGASPLIAGHGASHWHLERRLAEFEGTESAVVFTSGFAANLATVAALVERGDAIYADRLNHASLIDGCRLSRAEVHVYPHGDATALESQLRAGVAFRRRLIVTDSLFSMDGDLAPLADLADLAERYDAMLLVDEAHATGVLGQHGRGLAEQQGVEHRVHVRVGTLSKALGSSGGFVCGRQSLIDWLINRARAYVFSTAPPAACCAAAAAAVEIVEREPQRRQSLLSQAARLRGELEAQGWNTGRSASQIVPLVVGAPERALALAAQLRAQCILVPAIRPPTVPAGGSCLRISLTAAHTPEMIDRLVAALGELAGRDASG
jgi:8-amino-7-oxononanoate synthase